jgi:hypothetical protein
VSPGPGDTKKRRRESGGGETVDPVLQALYMGTSSVPKSGASTTYAPLAYDEPFLFDDDTDGGMSALDMLLQFDGLVVPSALMEPRDGVQVPRQVGALADPSAMVQSPLPVPEFFVGGVGASQGPTPPPPPPGSIGRNASSTGGSGRVMVPITYGHVGGDAR